MRTFSLQVAVTILALLFGLLALRVGRVLGWRSGGGASWMVVGIGFTTVSTVKALQNVFGAAALRAGEGSPLWESYLAWAPAFDHSRTVALIVLFPLLYLSASGWSLVSRSPLAVTATVLSAALATGATIGIRQDGFVTALHFQAVAVLDTIELITLLVVLFGLLVRDLVDHLLWIALALHAFKLSMNAIWTAALTVLELPGTWSPSPLHMHVYRAVLTAGMLFLAWRRLRLLKLGHPVPALFEPLRRSKAPLS